MRREFRREKHRATRPLASAYGRGRLSRSELVLALVAYIHGRWLPWQFAIREDGLSLAFPFGRRLFLPRQSLTVRIEMVGAIAMVGRRRHFGYLLMDRLGYEPNNEERLRGAFSGFGYNLLEPG